VANRVHVDAGAALRREGERVPPTGTDRRM
jgi:hypothetical protein